MPNVQWLIDYMHTTRCNVAECIMYATVHDMNIRIQTHITLVFSICISVVYIWILYTTSVL